MNLGYVYFNSGKAMNYKAYSFLLLLYINLNSQQQLENNCRQALIIDVTQ